MGLQTLVFLHTDRIQPYIHSIEMAVKGCGLMGTLGNKGAVAAKICVHESTICFVNCHLAAHKGHVGRRNQDYARISTQLAFGREDGDQYELGSLESLEVADQETSVDTQPAESGELHTMCDALIWFGDVNYRIDLPNDTVRAALAVSSSGDDGGEGSEEAPAGGSPGSPDLESLRQADQLLAAIAAGDAFRGFTDVGPLNFMPTYKFDKGTSDYDTSEKQRVPAWPDRILSRHQDDVRLLTQDGATGYTSHDDLLMSDHRPITADLSVGLLVADESRKDAVIWQTLAELDALENQTAPKLVFSSTTVRVNEESAPLGYMTSATQSCSLRNEGKLPSTFRFIRGVHHRPLWPGESASVSAVWLQVSPASGVLMPGESRQLLLTACVGKHVAAPLTEVLLEDGKMVKPGQMSIELDDVLVVSCSGMSSKMQSNAFLQVPTHVIHSALAWRCLCTKCFYPCWFRWLESTRSLHTGCRWNSSCCLNDSHPNLCIPMPPHRWNAQKV